MKRTLFAACLVALLGVAGCGSSSAPDSPPANVVVTPGDGRVVLTWTSDPSNSYWVFYAPGNTLSFPGSTNVPGNRTQDQIGRAHV